jgi:hypothetical protein
LTWSCVGVRGFVGNVSLEGAVTLEVGDAIGTRVELELMARYQKPGANGFDLAGRNSEIDFWECVCVASARGRSWSTRVWWTRYVSEPIEPRDGAYLNSGCLTRSRLWFPRCRYISSFAHHLALQLRPPPPLLALRSQDSSCLLTMVRLAQS